MSFTRNDAKTRGTSKKGKQYLLGVHRLGNNGEKTLPHLPVRVFLRGDLAFAHAWPAYSRSTLQL